MKTLGPSKSQNGPVGGDTRVYKKASLPYFDTADDDEEEDREGYGGGGNREG